MMEQYNNRNKSHPVLEPDREIECGNTNWTVHFWELGMDIGHLKEQAITGFDTEYEVRKPGDPQRTVLLQAAFPNREIYLVRHHYMKEFIEKVHALNPDMLWAGFNTPVDLHAVDYRNTSLYDKVLDRNKYTVQDLMIRCALYEISSGEFISTGGLSFYVKKYLGIDMPKDDDVRMNFKQDMEFTDKIIEYSAKDAAVTLMLAQFMPIQTLEQIKSLCNLALNEMSERGYPADEKFLEKVREREKETLYNSLEYLTIWGYWPKEILGEPTGVTGGEKELQAAFEALEKQLNIEFSRSSTGKVSISEENDPARSFLENDLPVHPLITEYKKFRHSQKMISTYLKKDHIREDGRWHPRYNPILKTGRTSAHDPPTQTWPQEGDHRGVFCADPGHVLLVIDVDQAELCALAESCYQRFGFSKMMELINEGYDLHQYYAEENIIKIMMGEKIENLGKSDLKKYRQQSKPINFGYPGGLGISTFVTYAKNSWGMEFSTDFAKQAKELWLETFPEMTKHLRPVPDEGYWLRNLKRELKKKDISTRNLDSRDNVKEVLRHEGWTDDEISDLEFRTSAYRVKTIHGRVKRNCNYTAACNYEFQASVADAMSYAMIRNMEKNIPQVAFIHDEIHYHLPRDKHLQDNIKLCEDTLRESVQEMFPNVKIGVESALMSRWYKQADPVYDNAGNLLEWTPEMAKD